jgi:hypothetical protein
MENLRQDIWLRGQDLNGAPPEYISRTLPLHYHGISGGGHY